MTSTTAPAAILHRFQSLDAISGTVHVGTASRHGGFSAWCTGRHISFTIGTPREVTCKSCIAKATKAGVDTKEL